jgi:diguanylate cyclase (GGDEF)-like protein
MTAPQPASEPRRSSAARFSRPTLGFPVKPNRWREFWATPVPVLIAAGAAGEVLVARTRLVLTLLVLLVPVLDWLQRPGVREVYIGLAAAGFGVLAAAVAYRIARGRVYEPRLGFATSLLDVTLVSAVLCTFLVLHQPLTAVNSRVVFLVYFVAIGASALRFDPRICAVTGAAAVLEYLAIVAVAWLRWPLPELSAASDYGAFSWSDQGSRLILLIIAGVVSTTLVLRTRELQWLSARDKLTGLLNRGVFDDLLQDAALRARRYGRPLSILMLDVDKFKPSTTPGVTRRGRGAQGVAAAISSRWPGRNRGRYGGDEFVVLFRNVAGNRGLARRQDSPTRPADRRGDQGTPTTVPVTISIVWRAFRRRHRRVRVLNQADMRL